MRNSGASAFGTAGRAKSVVIAGAGPAGAVAAHVLAQAGWRTLLADRATPEFKVGDALPAAARRVLGDAGLSPPSAAHARIGGNLSSWNSPELHAIDFFTDPEGAGWRLDRTVFERELRQKALTSGAVLKDARLIGFERIEGLWCVHFDDGTTETAHRLIDATGRRAALAQKLGARRYRDSRLVAIYAQGESHSSDMLNRTIVEAVPDGWWYAGRLPSGRMVVGYHALPEDIVPLARNASAWRRALAETMHVAGFVDPATFVQPTRSCEACGARIDPLFGDGWATCGDAALSFDPLSGQGILAAIYGGIAVARALMAEAEKGSGFADFEKRMLNVRRFYLARWRSAYLAETRWRSRPFWRSMQSAAACAVEMGGQRGV